MPAETDSGSPTAPRLRIEVLTMPALRVCLAVVALALALVAPVAAQQAEDMKIGWRLLRDLTDEDVQRQLIAAGSLDAPIGRASREELGAAIKLFRKAHFAEAYRGKDDLVPLTVQERAKLEEIHGQFKKKTGLDEASKTTDPKTGVRLVLPTALVRVVDVKDETERMMWSEYQAEGRSLAIGPLANALSEEAPLSLFRTRILSTPGQQKHKVLHLTSAEFTSLAELEVRDEEVATKLHRHFTYNRVITVGDQVKGLFMIYNLKAPRSFKLSDYAFLEKMAAAKDSEADAPKPDPNDTGWQLLMQGITHLVASAFPLDNGWEKVSTKDCTLDKDADGDRDALRIVFGTDRKIKSRPQGESVKDPDTLLDTEPGRSLHMGCAFISKTAAKSMNWSELIESYRVLHEGKPGDVGEHLYLRDETGRGRGTRSDALLFVHGYNVPFKYALQTIGTIVAETGYKGRVYLYSWPSAESTVRYVQDLDRAEQAEPYFQSFMRMLMRDANINEIDLLAHSMGSQTMLRAASALRPIFETTRVTPFGEKKIRIGQLIFAAPDVDRSVFDQKLRRVAPYAKRVTIYVSSSDAALLASTFLRGGIPRVGEIARRGGDPIRVDLKNVHVIDATGRESWYRLDRILRGYGHDYLQQAKEVRDDIGELLQADRRTDRLDPSERDKAGQRFTRHDYADAPGVPFWRIIAK
jgi:hypothetical protein